MAKSQHIHPALADLYAAAPTKCHLLNAAYELGLGNLEAALAGLTRPAPNARLETATCINHLPAKPVHILNTLVLAQCLHLVLPHYLEALDRDERRTFGPFANHLNNLLKGASDALLSRGIFRAYVAEDGTPVSGWQAGRQYAEDMADLTYECLHELNDHPDPRAPHAAMRCLNKLNLVQELPAAATPTDA